MTIIFFVVIYVVIASTLSKVGHPMPLKQFHYLNIALNNKTGILFLEIEEKKIVAFSKR